jgi:single-strand DNA-binding protein
VEGRLRLEEYTDREGQKRFSAEVSATEIQFLGHRTDSHSVNATEEIAGANQPPAPQPKPQVGNSNNPKKTSKSRRSSQEELVSIEDDEIPF